VSPPGPLTITRKGGKVVAIPLAPRTARGDRAGPRRTLRRADLPFSPLMGGDWTVMALGGSSHTYLHWGEYRLRQGAAGDQ
jgi:hypothetical protein